MGHDISIICNHKLQTETSLILGHQISEIFCVPIEVYVQRFYKVKSMLDINYFNDEYEVLGNLKNGSNKENRDIEKLQLTDGSICDESFECLDAYKLYGKDLLKTKYGKMLYDDATKHYLDSPWYAVYINSTCNEAIYTHGHIDISVHRHMASPHLYFYPRWWSFSTILFKRNFQNNSIEDRENSFLLLMEYRKRIKTIIKLIGGTEAYYFSSQSNACYLDDYGMHHTWQETKVHIEETFGMDIISISEFIINKQVMEKEDYYPKVFYDDFKDL